MTKIKENPIKISLLVLILIGILAIWLIPNEKIRYVYPNGLSTEDTLYYSEFEYIGLKRVKLFEHSPINIQFFDLNNGTYRLEYPSGSFEWIQNNTLMLYEINVILEPIDLDIKQDYYIFLYKWSNYDSNFHLYDWITINFLEND